jgi:predicted amidohydrolase
MALSTMGTRSRANTENSSNGTIRAAIIQMDCRLKDKAHNLEKAVGFLQELEEGTDIVCFPELFTTGYNLELIGEKFYELAEKIPGPTTDLLAEKAQEKNLAILGNIVEKESGNDSRLFDTAFAIDREGRLVGKYRKYYLYPPERRLFHPGKDISVVDLGVARGGMAICFDHAFPELFRVLGVKGAQFVFIPSAVPVGYEYLLNLRTRARAQDNQFFVLAANRVGTEAEVQYCGSSKIVDPKGEVLVEASGHEEQIISRMLNLSEIAMERKQEPVLYSLRREIYGLTSDLIRRGRE